MQFDKHLPLVLVANTAAIGFSFAEIKEILQLLIMVLSCIYTIIQLIKSGKETIKLKKEQNEQIQKK